MEHWSSKHGEFQLELGDPPKSLKSWCFWKSPGFTGTHKRMLLTYVNFFIFSFKPMSLCQCLCVYDSIFIVCFLALIFLTSTQLAQVTGTSMWFPFACRMKSVISHAPASPYSKSESFMQSSDLLLLRHCLGQTRHIHRKLILRLEVGLSYAFIFALNPTVVATWTNILRQTQTCGLPFHKNRITGSKRSNKNPQALTGAHCLETMLVWLPARLLL